MPDTTNLQGRAGQGRTELGRAGKAGLTCLLATHIGCLQIKAGGIGSGQALV